MPVCHKFRIGVINQSYLQISMELFMRTRYFFYETEWRYYYEATRLFHFIVALVVAIKLTFEFIALLFITPHVSHAKNPWQLCHETKSIQIATFHARVDCLLKHSNLVELVFMCLVVLLCFFSCIYVCW